MSISNLYTTLKLGWSFGVAITACALSYVIWNTLRGLTGGKLSQMTILENNCMQSTAIGGGIFNGHDSWNCIWRVVVDHGASSTVAGGRAVRGADGVPRSIPGDTDEAADGEPGAA